MLFQFPLSPNIASQALYIYTRKGFVPPSPGALGSQKTQKGELDTPREKENETSLQKLQEIGIILPPVPNPQEKMFQMLGLYFQFFPKFRFPG